jgi:hypothetical protein
MRQFTTEEQKAFQDWLKEIKERKNVLPAGNTVNELATHFSQNPAEPVTSASIYLAVQKLGSKLQWQAAEQGIEGSPAEVVKKWIAAGKCPPGWLNAAGDGIGQYLAERMDSILLAQHGRVYSIETLTKAAKTLQQELAAKIEGVDPNDSRQPGRASAFGKRTAEPEEHQTSDWEYGQRIQSLLGKLISSGYRAEAQKQSDAAKKLKESGASLKEVYTALANNVAEWSALQEISKIIQGSFGKTSGEVATNRTTLVAWVKEAKKQGKSAVDLARLLTALLPKGKSGTEFIVGGDLTFTTDPSGNLTVEMPRGTKSVR